MVKIKEPGWFEDEETQLIWVDRENLELDDQIWAVIGFNGELHDFQPPVERSYHEMNDVYGPFTRGMKWILQHDKWFLVEAAR